MMNQRCSFSKHTALSTEQKGLLHHARDHTLKKMWRCSWMDKLCLKAMREWGGNALFEDEKRQRACIYKCK